MILCLRGGRLLNSVLLCAIQKSGSSWVRFIIFNYFNIKNNHAIKTLTWDELQKPHLDRVNYGVDYDYDDSFPRVFHTHNSYDGYGINAHYDGYPEFFKQFDKMIYIYRNPFDCCLSYWHFMENRISVNYKRDLEEFTKWFLPKWIFHVRTTRNLADLVLNYDHLQIHPAIFRTVIDLITDDNLDENVLIKAINMSSFENIKRMSDEVGNPAGLGFPYYKGYFCRDGRTGQYKEVMSKELVEYIKKECLKEGIEV